MTANAWRSIPEPELVPYRALTTLPVQSLMVLAPHPDDEVFGCGGLLVLAAQQGVRTTVVVVSDGCAGGDAAVREVECTRAASLIGYAKEAGSLQFWRLPDRGVIPDEALIARIAALVRQQQPQWLLAPSPFEVHPDHRAVCRAAIEAVRGTRCELGFFEVGQPLLPNLLVDITAVAVHKQRAMGCFSSQLLAQRYDEQIAALNRYRAYTLGRDVAAAEAYWFPGAQPGAEAVLAAASHQLARRLGLG